MEIVERGSRKALISPNYNFIYDKVTGFFARWGENFNDDPQMSPFGPEILDLEISSGGDCLGNCPFCYKCNGGDQPTHNMTFDEFKTIFDKMPKTLTQIAFGIMNIQTNPDFFRMMEYAKENGVAPNYTCHGLDMTPEIAKRTAKLCGAVAVSLVNKKKTFETIKMLSINNHMTQVNCHYMLSEETYERAFSIIDDISSDSRLRKFNAIVFLQYKSKGRNPDGFNSILDISKYKALTDYCENKNVRYGFDSCSGPLFMETLVDSSDSEFTKMFVEPCESGLFSSYINCHGKFVYCSFAEGVEEEMDVLSCDDFLQDIWFNEKTIEWRKRLLGNDRACPIYDLSIKK